jgi:hypothetical protein
MTQPKPDLDPPPSGPVWWTGVVSGLGAGCALSSRAFDAREEIARQIAESSGVAVSPQDLEVTRC